MKMFAEWKYWEGWEGNCDQRIENATCSNCGYVHPTVKGSPEKLSDFCGGCGRRMAKTPNYNSFINILNSVAINKKRR